jgi:hypothetical protein
MHSHECAAAKMSSTLPMDGDVVKSGVANVSDCFFDWSKDVWGCWNRNASLDGDASFSRFQLI